MSRTIPLIAATLGIGLVSSSAFAAGLIRSPNVSNAGHAVLGLGNGSFLISNYSPLSANNALHTADPFGSSGSGTSIGFTDVDAGSATTAAFKNNQGSVNTVNQVPSTKWFLGGSLTVSGIRAPATAVPRSGALTESYVGNTATLGMNAAGTSIGQADIRIKYIISDGPTPGSMNVISTMKVTRKNIVGGATNGQAVSVVIGELIDLDLGSNGSASDVVTNISGAGETRLKYTDSSGVIGETLAVGASAFTVNTRSVTANSSNLAGAGSLNGSITGGSDQATGYLWSFSLQPVGTAGDSVTLVSAFSIGQSAFVPEPAALASVVGLAAMALRRRK